MSLTRFTQPLMVDRRLGARPVVVEVGAEKLTVARTGDGVFAYPERCPHRGTPLVHARVAGGRLVCPYHGWSVDPRGQVRRAAAADQVECTVPVRKLELAFGSHWLVEPGSPVPVAAPAGHEFCGSLEFTLSAPYHVVLDNFNEGSHTPYVHRLLGPAPSRLGEVRFEWRNDADSVFTRYDAPQRMNPLFRLLSPLAPLNWHIEWRTYFGPTYMQYDSRWYEPKSGRVVTQNRVYYYLIPRGADRTALHAFIFVEAPKWARWCKPVVRWVSRLITANQVLEDQRFYPKIAGLPESFKGLRLEPTDHPVVTIRKRAQAEYLRTPSGGDGDAQ